jgi:RNA polymerase-binding transcription factor DksA
MIPKEKQVVYEKKLLETKQELLDELERKEVPEDFGSDVDDFDEEKNEAEALGNQLAEGQSVRNRINEIDAALERIAHGTYGVCTACGGAISEMLLELVPESPLCEACKKKM